MNAAPHRLPLESVRPVQVLAVVRLALALLTAALVLALGFPFDDRVAAVTAGVAVPWSVACQVIARRRPDRAFSPLIAIGDVAVLAAVEAVAPETYGGVRFMALAFLAVHAHFQGERVGAAVAAVAIAALVLPAALSERTPVSGDLLVLYEAVFAAAALAAVWLVGRFRMEESASRLRARGVARQTIEAERHIRRRVAESLHDGPVQELIGLDMTLVAARRQAERDRGGELLPLLEEASRIASRNVEALRDEILDLGPYAYEDFSFEAAVERCVPAWKRRHGLVFDLRIERLELSSDVEAELFRITQEAVQNAARHGHASTVGIELRAGEREVRLRVTDDGRGFAGDPLASADPGHIGLASMRERAELIGGELAIESSEAGASVSVSVPRADRTGGA